MVGKRGRERGGKSFKSGQDSHRILARAAELLGHVVENTGDLVMVIDRRARLRFLRASTTYGLSPDTGVGQRVEKALRDIDAGELLASNRYVLETGLGMTSEVSVLWHGKPLRLLQHVYPIKDAHGKVEAVCSVARDVTRYHKAREAYRNLVRHALQGISVMRADGRLLLLNPAAETILGRSLAELSKQTLAQMNRVVHPADRALIRKTVKGLVGDKPSGVIEYRIRWPDGTIRWVAAQFSWIVHEGVLANLTCFLDITDRKRSEKSGQTTRARLERLVVARTHELRRTNDALQEELVRRQDTERLLRIQRDMSLALASTSSVGAACKALLDSAMQIEGVDGAGVYLLDPVSQRLKLIVHSGLPRAFVKQVAVVGPEDSRYQLVLKGKPVYVNRQALSRVPLPGAELFASVGILPIRCAGRVVASLNIASAGMDRVSPATKNLLEGLVSHIGEAIARIRTAEALQESEVRYRTLAESSPDLIYLCNREGDTLYVNAFGARTFGFTQAEMVGKRQEELFGPESAARHRHEVGEVFRSGRSIFAEREEAVGMHRLWINTRLVPIRDGQGKIVSVLGISRDVTERRRLEADRERLAASLLDVQEKERNDISGVLHDHVGQLLTLVQLEMGSIQTVGAESRRSRIKAMARIRDALTSVRRLAVSLRPALLDELGLESAVRELADEFGKGSGIRIQVRNHCGAPVHVDRDLNAALYRVIQEALTNTVRHSRAQRAVITLRATTRYVIARIHDNGRGFDPDRVAGKGIGLLSMQERLARLGGRLEITAAPGHGTTLVATIPRPRPAVC